MNPYEVIVACKNESSTNGKIDILKKNDSPLLRKILEHAVSPFISFGVIKHQLGTPATHTDFNTDLDLMWNMLRGLKNRNLTGNAAQEEITRISAYLNSEQQAILTMILEKDLRCGVNTKLINKALRDLIPTFDIQLANKDRNKIKFPCFTEIKRNGRRNIAIIKDGWVEHYSRNGMIHENFHIFDQEILDLCRRGNMVFDGEVSGNTGDHRKDYKAVQQQALRGKNVDTSCLRFTIWDCLTIEEWENRECMLTQVERRKRLTDLFTDHTFQKVFLSDTIKVNSMDQLLQLFDDTLAMGQEGLIVKDPDGLYEFKRSDAWIKMKCENDIDLEIIGVIEGTKSLAGTVGSIVVQFKNGQPHCGPKGFTHAQLAELWKQRDSLIGKTVTIVYMNETEDSLYLPKFTEIRDDK